MGCDIHPTVEVKNKDGVWEYVDGGPEQLQNRNYDRFAFLTGGQVRNYINLPEILPEPRGFPQDSERARSLEVLITEYGADYVDDHSASYFTLAELLEVDYSQAVTDRTGNRVSLMEALWCWDKILEDLKAYAEDPADVRILFDFDN